MKTLELTLSIVRADGLYDRLQSEYRLRNRHDRKNPEDSRYPLSDSTPYTVRL